MTGDAGLEAWEIEGKWKSRICPRKLITAETRDWLQLFSTYRAGHLLVSGGIYDQPALYVHAMTLIESFINEAQKSA